VLGFTLFVLGTIIVVTFTPAVSAAGS
jgi:hypothetical protein